MKRSGLKRRTPLKRAGRLRRRASVVQLDERAVAFKRVRDGICRVCGAHGKVRRHHVVYEQHVGAEHGDPWDARNSLWVGVGREAGVDFTCDCHRRHHDAVQRIPLSLISQAAIDFAIELFGVQRAAVYMSRYYAPGGAEMEAA